MVPSNLCLNLVKSEEGLPAPHEDGLYHAYHGKADKPGVWTIGYGTVLLPTGIRVKEGDTATLNQVIQWLEWQIGIKASAIARSADSHHLILKQNQFDPLVSFGYNEGTDGLLIKSEMWPKIIANPDDSSIHQYKVDGQGVPIVGSCEFLKWVYANGVVVDDLIWRRSREADMYAGRPFKYKA